MANLAIVGSFSVNGVAALHTKILMQRELKDFYEMMPEKFNNKTNGVSHRRFLVKANPQLTDFISNSLGDDLWIRDMAMIRDLEYFAEDEYAQEEFEEIKFENKCALAEYIKEHNHIQVDPHAIFSMHIKRIHEYKRQLMNVLRIRYFYQEMKSNPAFLESFYPMVFIFAGKVHPNYTRAKKIIKEIHKLADEVNADTSIHGKLKVVFLEDYRVSLAETIIPAADVSEQISTASKDASGTGNMKFMMNGALTLGTLDGANVEIRDEVGEDNMFLFGMHAEEVMEHEKNRDYIASHIYLTDEKIAKAVDGISDEKLRRTLLYNQSPWVDADRYFVLKDLPSYIEATWKLNQLYKNDRAEWNKKAILNVARSGVFSSDRTVEEYAKDIWKLKSVYEME